MSIGIYSREEIRNILMAAREVVTDFPIETEMEYLKGYMCALTMMALAFGLMQGDFNGQDAAAQGESLRELGS